MMITNAISRFYFIQMRYPHLHHVLSFALILATIIIPLRISALETQIGTSTVVHIKVVKKIVEKRMQKVIALTFDDGPYGTPTWQILDILKKEGVHATFFCTGNNILKYPTIARRIVADGNEIGNHTYTHPRYLGSSSPEVLRNELSLADHVIVSTTGIHTKLFRPPYGILSSAMRAELTKEGYTIVLWNIDPVDWDHKHSSSKQIERRILTHMQPVTIVVMHDGRDTHIGYPRDNTIRALPRVIRRLKKEGYSFVTISELSSTTLSKFQ